MKASASSQMYPSGSCPVCRGKLWWVVCFVCEGTGDGDEMVPGWRHRQCSECHGDGGSYWCSDCGAGYIAVELEAIDNAKMRVREWGEG